VTVIIIAIGTRATIKKAEISFFVKFKELKK